MVDLIEAERRLTKVFRVLINFPCAFGGIEVTIVFFFFKLLVDWNLQRFGFSTSLVGIGTLLILKIMMTLERVRFSKQSLGHSIRAIAATGMVRQPFP